MAVYGCLPVVLSVTTADSNVTNGRIRMGPRIFNYLQLVPYRYSYRMFIGPSIIVIVEELKTNLMSLVVFISLIICSTCFEH